MYLPDPRLEMPELLIPGRKPTGPVVIDWEHPLADGLVNCWVFGSNRLVDIVSGAELTPVGSSATPVVDQGGTAARTDDSPLSYYKTVIPLLDDYTYEATLTFKTVTAKDPICIIAETPGNGTHDRSMHVSDSSTIASYVYDGAPKSAEGTTTLEVGRVYVTHATCEASVEIRAALNGVVEATTAITAPPFGGYASPEFMIGVGSGGSASASGDLSVYMFCVWNRPLTDSEIAQRAANPYQFLIPA